MHRRKLPIILALSLQLLLLAPQSTAMTMLHYDLASLVFLSTDIVIADISESADHKFTATVVESLYGAVKPGDHLDTLTPFLSFFRPMETGIRVVLFLDRRPHQYDFFHSDAAKSPFAVPPSGVYLVDQYDHVHEYYQPNNPGPYVAQHYSYFFEQIVPTKEQDLALPSLAEVKVRIAWTIDSVGRVRSLLEKSASPGDFPALLHLIDPTNDDDCSLSLSSVIEQRALQNIRSLQDPGLYLRALSMAGPYAPTSHATEFIFPENGNTDKEFRDARIKFLLAVLTNKKFDPAQRIASVEMLINLSKFQTGPHSGPSQVLPIDNEWLGKFASKIQSTAKSIFDDSSQNPRLRGLALEFLDLDQPKVLADVKRIYAKTASARSVFEQTKLGDLRFAIEKSFLRHSDAMYASLNPPGGPVTSRIRPLPESVCASKLHKGFGFLLEFQTRTDYPGRGAGFPAAHAILTNLKSGARFELEKITGLGGWYSMTDGQFNFEPDTLANIPAGDYSLFLKSIPTDDKPSTSSYALNISVRDSAAGKTISILNSAKN